MDEKSQKSPPAADSRKINSFRENKIGQRHTPPPPPSLLIKLEQVRIAENGPFWAKNFRAPAARILLIASTCAPSMAAKFYEEPIAHMQGTNCFHMRSEHGLSFTKSLSRLFKALIASICAPSIAAKFYEEPIAPIQGTNYDVLGAPLARCHRVLIQYTLELARRRRNFLAI